MWQPPAPTKYPVVEMLRTRVRHGGPGEQEARQRLSQLGRRGAAVAKRNRQLREWVLDQLHAKKPVIVDPMAPVMNAEGDVVSVEDLTQGNA